MKARLSILFLLFSTLVFGQTIKQKQVAALPDSLLKKVDTGSVYKIDTAGQQNDYILYLKDKTAKIIGFKAETGGTSGGSATQRFELTASTTTASLNSDDLSGKHLEVYREGELKKVSSSDGYTFSGTTITFYPSLTAGETVVVWATESDTWSTGTLNTGSGGGGSGGYVTWATLPAGLSTANNGIVKSSGATDFSVLGRSTQQFMPGQSVTVKLNNVSGTAKLMGFASTPELPLAHRNEFGTYQNSNTNVYIWLDRTQSSTTATVANNGWLRYAINTSNFTLEHSTNGTSWTTLYTSTKVPDGPYYFIAGFSENGGGIEEVTYSGSATDPTLTWTNKTTGVAEEGNGIKYTGSGGAWSTNLATSVETISAGEYVEFFLADQDVYLKMIGLTNASSFAGYPDLDYGIFFTATGVSHIYESNASPAGNFTMAATDLWRIEYPSSGPVVYKRSTNFGHSFSTVYTSGASPSGTYNLACDFYSGSGKIYKVKKGTL